MWSTVKVNKVSHLDHGTSFDKGVLLSLEIVVEWWWEQTEISCNGIWFANDNVVVHFRVGDQTYKKLDMLHLTRKVLMAM